MKCAIFIILIISFSLKAIGEDAIYIAEHAGDCGKWQVEFFRSGYVHETNEEFCQNDKSSYYRLHPISRGDLDSIASIIVSAGFDKLPDSIEPKTFTTDEEYFMITVVSDHKKKVVFAQGLQRAKNPADAKHFEEIWHKINKVIKEPDE